MLTWGRLTGEAILRGQTPSAFDSLLAATAVMHGLTFVTRNTRDVVALPVVVFNPWDA